MARMGRPPKPKGTRVVDRMHVGWRLTEQQTPMAAAVVAAGDAKLRAAGLPGTITISGLARVWLDERLLHEFNALQETTRTLRPHDSRVAARTGKLLAQGGGPPIRLDSSRTVASASFEVIDGGVRLSATALEVLAYAPSGWSARGILLRDAVAGGSKLVGPADALLQVAMDFDDIARRHQDQAVKDEARAAAEAIRAQLGDGVPGRGPHGS